MSFNMFGWDTVYAISTSAINKVLAVNQDKTLQKLGYEAGAIKMTGVFDPWFIVSGGSGKLLRMAFPIASGTFVSPGQPNADLANVTLIADVELTLLPSGVATKSLVFNMSSVAKGTATGPGFVTPINLLDPDRHLNAAQHAEIFGLLPAYLVQQASTLSFAFAEVDFAKPAVNSWLAPVEADYAIMAKDDGSNYLGILAVTTQRDVAGLKREIDNGIVSGANNAGLFIASDLFLENVILPILPSAYPGTSVATFHFDAASQSIKNTKHFGTPSVKSGAITYHPTVDNLTTRLSGGDLETELSGSVDLKAGINMTYEVGVSNASRFDPATQLLAFLKDSHPSSSHHVHVPWYFIAGGVIALVVANIVASIISNSISDTLENRAKVTIAKAPSPSVRWTGTTPIDVKDAGLDNLFYLQGAVTQN